MKRFARILGLLLLLAGGFGACTSSTPSEPAGEAREPGYNATVKTDTTESSTENTAPQDTVCRTGTISSGNRTCDPA